MIHPGKFLTALLAFMVFSATAWTRPAGRGASNSAGLLTARQKRLAKRSFRRAMYWLHRKRYDRALSILRQAYDKWKSPSFLYNLAVVYALKGDPVSSVEYLRRYRRMRPDEDAKLPRPLQHAKDQVALLVVRAPDSKVAIYVNGERKGTGHIEIVMLPGTPTVEMRRGRTVLKTKKVHLEAGRQTLWDVDSIEPPRPRAQPRPTRPIPSTAQPGHSTTSRWKNRLHWAYFTAAGATALVALAAAVGLSAKTKSTYQDFVGTDRTDENLARKGNAFQNSANAMWALTGTMTVAAAVLAVFTRWKNPKQANELLTIGPTGATIKLMW